MIEVHIIIEVHYMVFSHLRTKNILENWDNLKTNSSYFTGQSLLYTFQEAG